MPGVKGDEFLIQIHQKYPQTVKILLSGHVDPKAIRRMEIDANLDRCLAKPWDKNELLELIEEAVA